MTPSVNCQAKLVASPAALTVCRDLDHWPRSWMGVEQDLPSGEALVDCFLPFIEHLASSNLSSKTIRRHVDNLWLLGGELIRSLHDEHSRRRLDAVRFLREAIDDEGGPLIHNGSEGEQRSVDSTCRKFHRFLNQQPS